jgi:hypothetical protein
MLLDSPALKHFGVVPNGYGMNLFAVNENSGVVQLPGSSMVEHSAFNFVLIR